jgi:hypothetical protein
MLLCYNNQLTSLEVTKLTSLTELYCQTNNIPILDVSELTNLTILNCYNNQLTSLDVSSLVNLTYLYCSINQIAALDVSSLTNLTFLSCYATQLTSLDVSALSNLTTLVCASNQLSELDVSGLTQLEVLICNDNQLTFLDVSALVNMTGLYCYGNHLTGMDASALSNLEYLECYNNRLPFSSLATGLHADNYSFIPQDILFEPQSVSYNITLDYTDESIIEGTVTEFKFFKNGAEAESNTSGIYTTTGNGEYYCTMTNAKFPGLTLTTAAVTVAEGTGVADVISTGMIFYPNPAKDIVHLQFDIKQATYIYIELYNTNGILVCQPVNSWMEPAGHDIAIDLTLMPKGTYIVRLCAGDEIFYKKLVLL